MTSTAASAKGSVPPAVEVAVVGGGIVGLATALALAESGRGVAVLEAEPRLAAHQSGRNSGVLHSGIYYPPGSLKARLCIDGHARMLAFCREHRLPHRLSGKLILATAAGELPALDELERRARAHGLAGVDRLGPEAVRRREPAAAGLAGLWVPQTGVVDFAAVCRTLAAQLEAAGGRIELGARVDAIERRGGRWRLDTAGGAVEAAYLVGCAGLQSDRLARRCGLDPEVRILPFRGEYFTLAPEAAARVRGLIYPVPDPRLPFLGVHLTRGIDGAVHAGPNAVPALSRGRYGRASVTPRDAVELLAFPGFWRLAARYPGAGMAEIRRSLSRRRFAADLSRLVPGIEARHLAPAPAGLRAQCVDRSGRLVDDFAFAEGEGALVVLNAPSPAATAALAIGREIAGRVASAF